MFGLVTAGTRARHANSFKKGALIAIRVQFQSTFSTMNNNNNNESTRTRALFGRRKILSSSIIHKAVTTIINNITTYSSMQGAVSFAGSFLIGVANPFDHCLFKGVLEGFKHYYTHYNNLTTESEYISDPEFHFYFLRTVATTSFYALLINNSSMLNYFTPEGVFDTKLEFIPPWVFKIIKKAVVLEDFTLAIEFVEYSEIQF